MVIGICSNALRDINYEVAKYVADFISNHGSIAVFEDDIQKVDLIVSIGGDGTLLSTIYKFRHLGVPFVGINKGSIGFLTDIELDRIVDYKAEDSSEIEKAKIILFTKS